MQDVGIRLQTQAQIARQSLERGAAKATRPPKITCSLLKLERFKSGTASADADLVAHFLAILQPYNLQELCCCEPCDSVWAHTGVLELLATVQRLNLSGCSLTEVPSTICTLTALRQLNVCDNKLTALPARIGDLTNLEVLKADANAITALPGAH